MSKKSKLKCPNCDSKDIDTDNHDCPSCNCGEIYYCMDCLIQFDKNGETF